MANAYIHIDKKNLADEHVEPNTQIQSFNTMILNTLLNIHTVVTVTVTIPVSFTVTVTVTVTVTLFSLGGLAPISNTRLSPNTLSPNTLAMILQILPAV
jgi:hypothetical protein